MSSTTPALKLPHVDPTTHPVLEAQLRHALDHKTKPLGALGRLSRWRCNWA